MEIAGQKVYVVESDGGKNVFSDLLNGLMNFCGKNAGGNR